MTQPFPTTTTQFLTSLVRPYAGRLAVGIAAMLVTTACMLVIPQYLKKVFDAAITHQDMAALNWLMLEAAGMVILLSIGVFARTIYMKQVAHSVSWLLVDKIFQHLTRMHVAFFETRGAGDIISRASNDAVVINQFLENGSPMIARGALLAIGAYGILIWTNPALTLVLSVTAPVLAFVTMLLGRKWKVMSKKMSVVAGASFAKIEELVNGIRLVRSYGAEQREIAAMHHIQVEGLDLAVSLAKWRAGFFSFVVLLGFFSIMMVVWLGGRDVIAGTMSLGELMAFLLYLAFLGDGVSNLAGFWPMLNTAQAAAERIMELLAERPSIVEPAKPTALPKAKGARGVELKNVVFAYASRPEVNVADGISFKVKAGEKVAIVGPSGAGKSTLFSLLLRFYDVTSGAVTVDGVDVRKLAFASLRGAVAVVAQESAIFSTTVRANVAYGRPEATEDEVWAALKVAHADGFVRVLPQGLETPVGEKGVQLSGGQRQRLAIARAVLVDAPILLLDEATSHLDAESERAVQAALEEAGKGRTVVTIAHRLATVKAADRIVVLDKGKVVEEGTHAELMKHSKLYAALARLQMVG
ncbi:MAG: ABC transporter transmembrane domain-containing protein [Alphaproteobacteria bacterium]